MNLDFFLSLPFLLILLGISFYVQWQVTHVIKKYHGVHNTAGLTGKDLAQKMLNVNAIHDVKVVSGKDGWVGDYYDPRQKIVHLSPEIYSKDTVSALAVAAHEIGHAIQHKEGYFLLKIRNYTYPLARLGSWLGPIFLIIGIFLQVSDLFIIGIYFYAAAVLFTVLNLPVEFDASRRAKIWLHSNGLVSSIEKNMVSKLLNAAAMTYVMAAIIAIIQLLRMIMLSRR